ncbi:MAG: ATP-binding protein [Chloroflexota bacterium]
MTAHLDEHAVDQELRQAERRARLLHAANQVGKQATAILKLDVLLPKTVDIICDAYGFYYAGIFLVDAAGKWAVLRAGRGAAGAVMIAQGHKLAVGGDSMIGWAMLNRQARIALDVGADRVHFKNPLLPHTRSEIALPLIVGERVFGALTVQSIEPSAFSQEDILTLQTMADHLAIAISNAMTLKQLELANAELLRTKTYEALTASTTQAIHWIGNKAVPITITIARIKTDLAAGEIDRQSLSEDLDLIDESARQIVEIKENLLGPAREQQPRPTLLADVVQAAAFHAGVPAAQLALEVMPKTPLVWADSTQLARAVANLMRNALEADASRLIVHISSAAEAGFVALEVRDDGTGIPAIQMDNIWAAFISSKPGHAGLGLPSCLHVVNQHHGQITLTSEVGKGTTARILLPAVESGETLQTEMLGPQQILLIDDEDPWAGLALQTLTFAGKHVTRSLALTGEPDLIIVDEALDARNIDDVLDAVQSAGLLDRTVVVSAALLVERATAYLQRGVKNVLLKPYTPPEFAELLNV